MQVILSKTKNIRRCIQGCQFEVAVYAKLPDLLLACDSVAIFVLWAAATRIAAANGGRHLPLMKANRWETTVQIADGQLASELIRAGIQPKDVNFLTVKANGRQDFTLIRNYMPNLVA